MKGMHFYAQQLIHLSHGERKITCDKTKGEKRLSNNSD